MKRNIASVVVFKTPFESEDIFMKKWEKVREMFDDYIINSQIHLEYSTDENNLYQNHYYIQKELDIEIIYRMKKDFTKKDSLPGIILDYFLNENKLQKENIEIFLNDNIKFIFNVYFHDFFLEFDPKYKLSDFNQGKKIDYKNLEKFDTSSPLSKQNKNTLDSMMFLYYNLIKNILQIENNQKNIGELLEENILVEFEGNLNFFSKKQDSLKENLVGVARQLKNQIDTFVQIIE